MSFCYSLPVIVRYGGANGLEGSFTLKLCYMGGDTSQKECLIRRKDYYEKKLGRDKALKVKSFTVSLIDSEKAFQDTIVLTEEERRSGGTGIFYRDWTSDYGKGE